MFRSASKIDGMLREFVEMKAVWNQPATDEFRVGEIPKLAGAKFT